MRARARIFHEDGSVTDVTDKTQGADEYFTSWKSNVEQPHPQRVSGWQRSDESHSPGSGQPAYRVAYKSLRLIPYPSIEMTWPNLRISFINGDLERGGIRFEDTISGRRADQHVIPEYGRVVGNVEDMKSPYVHSPNLNFRAAAWEETIQAITYVEVLWIADADERDPIRLLEMGRNAVAPLLTLLELEYGPRLLSTRVLEEVGETFQDWHWNRQILTGTAYAESQASLVKVAGREFASRLEPLIERNQGLAPDERSRLRLAARWYWSAQEETDDVLAFIEWWLVIETLEMPKTTDIRPVRIRLSILLATDEHPLRERVGRLFGLRSRVVHGEDRTVEQGDLDAARKIACLLLAARAGTNTERYLREVIPLFGLSTGA